ncbi:hypothetical protein PTSG_11196 [Salpingoeca rosetta]|uniref:VWFA domain-containing protein n=1 Tax=Salpingoeca rosetta (strain ATCC 50818 / BSB-021) TaxID=946362 RepID=F2USP7_SALR5|nr:uncharacterized protein PTSG_11196 [Salpingoeca rosetta]EGD81156.1 hypothetical protein PTSG_11196 [Salpingoeca rosetta]|eukprot:XP_004987841.1 hypothetical protein PTSG_11196 [Salpingoeca rosetta]
MQIATLARVAILLAVATATTSTYALLPGEWYPDGSTEAQVSGTAVDYIDLGTAQYNALIDFEEFYLNSTGTSSPVTFASSTFRLMTEYLAEKLTALALDTPDTIVIVQGFAPRPTNPTRPPELTDIGRGLHMRYLNNGSLTNFLSDLANRSIEAGFDFVAIPGQGSYVNVSVPNVNCGRSAVDLLFILDGSGSIGSSNFETMRQFTATVTSFFDVSPDTTRVALMVYSSSVTEIFDFSYVLSNTRDEIITTIRNTNYPGGGTRTGSALDYARTNMFLTSRGARPSSAGVPRVAIVIIDGQSGDSVAQPAENLRNENVNIFAIGISGADVNELNMIASPPITNNVKFIDTFQAFSQLPAEISRANCEQPAVVSATDEIQINDTQPGEIRFFRPNPVNLFDNETYVICYDVFVSVTSPNPGPFNFDYVIMNDEPLKTLNVRKTSSQVVSIAVRSRLTLLGRRRAEDTISYRLRVFNDLFNGPASHTIMVTPARNQRGAPIFDAPEAINFPGYSFTYTLTGPGSSMFDIDASTGRITLRDPLPDGTQHVVTLTGTSGSIVGGLALMVTTGQPTAEAATAPFTDVSATAHGDLHILTTSDARVWAPCSTAADMGAPAVAPFPTLFVGEVDLLHALRNMSNVARSINTWAMQEETRLFPAADEDTLLQLQDASKAATTWAAASLMPACTPRSNDAATLPDHAGWLETADDGTLHVVTQGSLRLHIPRTGTLRVGDFDVVAALVNASNTLDRLRFGITDTLPSSFTESFPAEATAIGLPLSNTHDGTDPPAFASTDSLPFTGIAVDDNSGELHMYSERDVCFLHTAHDGSAETDAGDGGAPRVLVGGVDIAVAVMNVTALINTIATPLQALLDEAKLTLDCSDPASRNPIPTSGVSQVGSVVNCCCPELTSLRRVLGDVHIATAATSADVGALQDVLGSIVLSGGQLASMDFGALRTIGGHVRITGAPLTSINLGSIVSIGGDLDLRDNTALTSVSFGDITSIGGTVLLPRDTPGIGTVDFSHVRVIHGDVDLTRTDTTQVLFGSLTHVGGTITIAYNAITNVDFSDVSHVGGDVVLIGDNSLESVFFNALTRVDGSLIVQGCTALSQINTWELHHIGGDLRLSNNVMLLSVSTAALRTIGGDYDVRHTAVSAVTLTQLTRLGGMLWVDHDLFTTINHAELAAAGGGLGVCCGGPNVDTLNLFPFLFPYGIGVDSMAGLRSLSIDSRTVVNGSLVITNNAALTAVSFHNAITAINGHVEITSNPMLASLQLTSVAHIRGDVTVTRNAIMSTIAFPLLTAHNHSLILEYNDLAAVDIGELTYLGGSLSLYRNNLGSFALTDLQYIGGDLSMAYSTLTTVSFGALTSVGGYLHVGYNPLQRLNFANITRIGGYVAAQGAALSAVDFGALTSVGGILNFRANVGLTSVDCHSVTAECIAFSTAASLFNCPKPCD